MSERVPPAGAVAEPDPADIITVREVTGCKNCRRLIWRRARRRSTDEPIPFTHLNGEPSCAQAGGAD